MIRRLGGGGLFHTVRYVYEMGCIGRIYRLTDVPDQWQSVYMSTERTETLKDIALGLAIGTVYAVVLLGAIVLRWGF